MYKSLSMLAGAIIALMILSNGLMVEATNNISAVVLNHMIGLCLIGTIFLIKKEAWHSLKGIPPLFLFAGLTGIFTVYFTNVSFLALGATVTLMLGMVSRIITSLIIDSFGLFKMTKYPFHPKKLIGLGFMVLGILLIVIS